MSLAALVPDAVERAAIALAPVLEADVRRWAAEYEAVIEEARRDRPEDASDEETRLLARVLELSVMLRGILGERYDEIMRSSVSSELDDAVRFELEAQELPRRLALRHLQEAVRELVAFQGAFVLAISELTPDERRQWELLTAKLADQASPEMLVEDEGRRLLRWTLDVIVALVVMEGDIDDLAFWARRALEGARFARALRDAHGPLDLRGELAKARAQLAWTDWDDEDVATELAPWPQDA